MTWTCVAAAACCTAASDEDTPPAASQPAEAAESADERADQLTGDWGGVRTKLDEQVGLDIAVSMTQVWQQNFKGGVNTHNAESWTGSGDLELTWDFETLGLVPGGVLYVDTEFGWNDSISDQGDVGDWFGVNYDAVGDQPARVYELWYEQTLFDGQLRFKLGKIGLSNEFDTNAFANDESTQFLNVALVNAGNIPFKESGQGAQLFWRPCDAFYAGAGFVDAHGRYNETGFRTAYHGPADFFSMYEFGLTPSFASLHGQLPGAYRFGLWYDPQPKEVIRDDLDGRRRTPLYRRDDVGFYVNMDQLLWRENGDDPDDAQGFGLFARYGYAHADVNEIEHFWSVGGQYLGLIPGRDADVLAFGATQGVLSERLHWWGMDPHRETVLETYYSIELAPWAWVTPDSQWILRPGGERGRDAFVAGLRLQMSF